ncbi:TonB-dependent receptor [Taibaiella helva]|uniref:TonB-dependent receptor n=1 Tax=Taibaiella helva TaxID=2301235 RepID=UPI000E5988C0|nr:TonB-dependent receptor [Taibaiella helva]
MREHHPLFDFPRNLKRQLRIFPVCLILLLLHSAFARLNAQEAENAGLYTLEGWLTDSSNHEAVGFATVTLYDTVRRQIAAEIADSGGHFLMKDLPAGPYSLEATFLGYETTRIAPVHISNASLNLGSIGMKPEKQNLGTVTITATKALIQDKGDRIVYNTENDITNSGGVASDVLRKVPGVSVDPGGQVALRGSSNIKVLINGKPSSIMARNLGDALKMIPANTIKSIEIMTTPSARFDAEGAGGVINIITKKGLKGTTGNVNITGGNFEQGIGGMLGFKTDKLETNFSFNLKREREKSKAERSRSMLYEGTRVNTLFQTEDKDNTSTTGFAELNMNYTPDTLNTIGFAANIWGGEWPSNRTGYSKLTNDTLNRVMEEYTQATRFKNPYYNVELNLSYNRKMKRPGREFSLLGQYSYMIDNYPYTTDQLNMANQLTYREHNTNKSHNGEWTLQGDYTHPIGKHVLELGAKGIIRTASSDYRVESSEAGGDPAQLLPNPARTNVFDYTQGVGSAYASLKLNFSKDWMLVAGGRVEYTYVKGDFKTNNTSFDTRYTNWIPSIILSRKFGGMHTIKASYTQRIFRPQVWSLNPFIDASDPKNQFTGNPNLKPELNHVVEFSYNLTTKGGANINTTLYGRRLNNSIEEVATPLSDGAWLTRKENIGNMTRYGISESASVDITKQWSVNGDLDLEHVSFKSPAWENTGWIFRTNLNMTYRLPKDYTLQASGGWNTGWIWFQGRNYGWHYYMIGAKKEFWNKNASITVNIANPFETNLRVRVKEERPNSVASTHIDFVRPSFRLTFAWKFGQLSDGGSKKVKKVENDDKTR